MRFMKNMDQNPSDDVQFAAGGDDFEDRKKHVKHQRQRGQHHEPVKPRAVLAVGEGGEPAAHGGIVELHNSRIHEIGIVYNMNAENNMENGIQTNPITAHKCTHRPDGCTQCRTSSFCCLPQEPRTRSACDTDRAP